MDRDTVLIVSALSSHGLLVLSGIMSMRWGYRLLTTQEGSWASIKSQTDTNELTAQHGKPTLTLNTSKPGVMFALFGAGLIVATIVRPAEFTFDQQFVKPGAQLVNVQAALADQAPKKGTKEDAAASLVAEQKDEAQKRATVKQNRPLSPSKTTTRGSTASSSETVTSQGRSEMNKSDSTGFVPTHVSGHDMTFGGVVIPPYRKSPYNACVDGGWIKS